MILTRDNQEQYLAWLEKIRCQDCGYSIESYIRTPSGKMIPVDPKCCAHCGTSLSDDTPSPWISVKDRLPDDDAQLYYLVYNSKTKDAEFGFWCAWEQEDEDWEDVTHWMPIPDRPEDREGAG